MTHYRSEYRRTALSALTQHPRFVGFTSMKVWPGTVGFQTLPVIGVLTPQERCEAHGRPSATRRTLLQVVVRRTGHDDVEDELDEDSAAIEAIISTAFLQTRLGCFLEDTSVVSNTDGRENVGTLVMSFRLISFRPVWTLPTP